jgi:hypothetical protein
MKQGKSFVVGMLTAALTFGVISAGCDNGTSPGGNDAFVAVTEITDLPTAAILNIPLKLDGTVKPSDATNRTIAWSGADVSDGVLTAKSAGDLTVTATIANGASESSPYTHNFIITVYDAGSDNGKNLFGNDASPYIWAMDDTGGYVYVTLKDTTWEATVEGERTNVL